MVVSIETTVLVSGLTAAATLGGKWLAAQLKKTSESILNAERMRQLRIDHEELKKRFEEYERDHRKHN